MPKLPETILKTERLVLRHIREGDAPALFAIYSDPEAMRYWSSPPWQRMAQAEDHVALTLAGYQDGSMLTMGMTLAQTGELIGVCRLHHFNQQNRRCEMGYILSRAHWGKGYMQEALAATIGHSLEAFGLHRIEADVDPRNAGSAALLKRLHFVHEGHLRQRWIVNGEVCDTDFFGLLRSDWDAARGK
ncbi:GCN5 family acetyltransferase [Massilia sp. Root418]|uniref:GNAT family N-acetyltransferase n=1 Tax=Massilia sp. Root418 TaxID=1736532 RepID=UPI0006FDF7EA|nr:GNAT family protein [Massilia sp. Root418]KQW91620.1 GCN5 family acetyltransferase [Massilia sp. Root418]